MTAAEKTLSDIALIILTEADPWQKAHLTRALLKEWHNSSRQLGQKQPPTRPARPEKPELRLPADMPKRRKAGSLGNKIALLHALAHIELNAIDLAWDLIARFSNYYEDYAEVNSFQMPLDFYLAWAKVADDEAKHFLLLSDRLKELGADYGDLPAHDGLWLASEKTAHNFPARLAIVPMVLEARGLDVTPTMISSMKKYDDFQTAEILQIIHDDEITHVEAGTVWFKKWCSYHGLEVDHYWQELVQEYFNGKLKRPFNDPSREKAGMLRHWYEPLAD